VQRYTDGLQVAAERLVGSRTLAELDRVDTYVSGLTDEPAWPTLRAHLIDLAAETGKHPLRHLYEAVSGRDLSTAGDMAAVLYWRLTALTTPKAGPLPGSPTFHTRFRTIPPGATTWPSEHNTSPTSPARFETSQPEPTISQSGLRREATRAPHSSAKSRCGGPPTASTPKTHDQPEGTNLRLPRTYGNKTSTEMSPAPSSRTTPTSMNDSHRVRHAITVTTTSSARIKHHRRTLRLRPAASDRSQGHNSLSRRLCLVGWDQKPATSWAS
jgi:hypothetical protein